MEHIFNITNPATSACKQTLLQAYRLLQWQIMLCNGMCSDQKRELSMLTLPRNAVIIGPADTPFEDGTFRLVMQFEEQYPNKPPAVKFISQMFHPNVYATGELCLDILQNRWSPTYDVAAVLTSIQRWAIFSRPPTILTCIVF